ncbi:MAG: putative lipid II flippase FtsW [Candidatus Marinimicrobia bacterium]|nr:putative lipid II flippase FtsW [Candidatus Neomarinimicrobiota bacterium]
MKTITLSMKNFDRPLMAAVVILAIIGTVMLYSASSSLSMSETSGRTDTVYLQAHLKRMLIGIIVLFTSILIDYRNLKNIAPWLMYGSIALLVITKAIFLIKGIHAPARWLYLGPISIQTADIARLSLIIYLAAYLDYKRDQIKDFYSGFVPPIVVIGILFALIVIQPDFSTAMMFGIITAVMLFMGGARLPHMMATGAVAIAVALPVMMAMPYRRARVLAWLYGTDDGSIGYQVTQSLISLGNGGFFGLGLGNSMEKNFFLPTPHTDFIFSIIGEEIGLIGTIFILTIFLFIFQRGIKIAKDCTDPFGIFLAIGISFNIVLYAFINAAVTTNIFPVTGLPMPLISYGGSGMIINFAAIGILLNISQSRRVVSRPSTMQRYNK